MAIELPDPDDLTYLTREQVREVDRRAIEEYGIPGVVLMENAGRGATECIRRSLDANHGAGGLRMAVAIVCGGGNNGGDGFVIARHLFNAGYKPELYLTCDPETLTGDAKINYDITSRMHLPMHDFRSKADVEEKIRRIRDAAIVVDAILGTGFHGKVRWPVDFAIQWLNESSSFICAIDVPSGLDCNTGEPSNSTILANETITFVARKTGFRSENAVPYLGRVEVVDIGAPPEIVDAVLSLDAE